MEIMELPTFFKVMPHDFKSLLRIPPIWVKTFEHMLPGHALLQTKSGETWHVKIEIVDGRHCFTDGWSKFVKDRQLKMNDFLVFWLIRAKKSIFRVATYGVTGCEKDINSASTSHVPFNSDSERSNATYGPRGRKSKKIKKRGRSGDVGYFELVLLKRHRSRLFVPAKFARETGLIHKKEVMVQYLNGWPITAPLKLYEKCGTLHLCGKPGLGGWPEFWRKNRLLERRKYGFKFVPETERILVQLVKEQC